MGGDGRFVIAGIYSNNDILLKYFTIGTAFQLEQRRLVCLKISCEAMLGQSNLCILSQTAERQQLEMKTVKRRAFNQEWGREHIYSSFDLFQGCMSHLFICDNYLKQFNDKTQIVHRESKQT